MAAPPSDAVHYTVYRPLAVFLVSFRSCADGTEQRLPPHMLLLCFTSKLPCGTLIQAKAPSQSSDPQKEPRTRQPRLRIPAPEVNGTFQTHSDNLKSGCTFVCGADENTSFVYFRLESNIYAQICPDYKPL